MTVDKNIKILFVEDSAPMRKIVRRTIFKKLGFENIVEAVDGQAAKQTLEEQGPVDLIISDWNMPNMDGLELLEWVRSSEHLKDIPFIMATAQGDKKQVQAANEAGASGYIAKPYSDAEISARIQAAMSGTGAPAAASDKKRRPRVGDSGKLKLDIAHIQITDHLVLGVLRTFLQKGNWTPRHFELNTMSMPGWNPVSDALENGDVDGALVLAPIAMDLFSVGTPLRLVLFAHKNGSICVRNKKHGILADETLEEFFKGKDFLIPHKLSVHNMLAHKYFSRMGLKPGVPTPGEDIDVSFEVVPPIKMPEYLSENPNAAGFIVAEPLGSKAVVSGVAELEFLSSEIWDNHPCCVVVMRQEVIEEHPEAVQEFTNLLVKAGQYIDVYPQAAAAMAVAFLDPEKKLGLQVPVLQRVLTEPRGIKTGDLYPVLEDLDAMQHYMHDRMGIGNLIDISGFADLRFADEACRAENHLTAFSA
jgi:ABC-type nitrate/sulfonate/bicarbonate transport system substrate-binding protein